MLRSWRRVKKYAARHVSRDKHDARQIAHLQSRSRSGETVDQAHRPQASTHEGEDRRGKDHLFSSNATDPQHVKAVLNRRHGAELCVAENTPPCEARQSKAERGVASTQRTSVRVHQDELLDGATRGWRVELETVE